MHSWRQTNVNISFLVIITYWTRTLSFKKHLLKNQYWISNRKTEIPVWEFSSFRIYKSVEKFDQFLSNDSILCLVTSYSDFCIQSSKGWWNCQTSEMSNLLGNSTTVFLRFVLNIFFGFLLLRGISTSQLTNQPAQKKN